MGRTQYFTASSLDGYIADQDNSLSWLFQVESEVDSEARIRTFFAEVGAFAMGATTYEWIVANERSFPWRDWYGDTPCWVFTHRDLPAIAGANLRFVQGDVGPVHEAMMAAAGDKNVWLVGGGELVGAFADQGKLDELILSVTPVTLGGGAPLLPRRMLATRLRLTGVEPDGQFVHLTYAVGAPERR